MSGINHGSSRRFHHITEYVWTGRHIPTKSSGIGSGTSSAQGGELASMLAHGPVISLGGRGISFNAGGIASVRVIERMGEGNR
jgi:hypothetical protein